MEKIKAYIKQYSDLVENTTLTNLSKYKNCTRYFHKTELDMIPRSLVQMEENDIIRPWAFTGKRIYCYDKSNGTWLNHRNDKSFDLNTMVTNRPVKEIWFCYAKRNYFIEKIKEVEEDIILLKSHYKELRNLLKTVDSLVEPDVFWGRSVYFDKSTSLWIDEKLRIKNRYVKGYTDFETRRKLIDWLHEKGNNGTICYILLKLQEKYVIRDELIENHKEHKKNLRYAKPEEFPRHPLFKNRIIPSL